MSVKYILAFFAGMIVMDAQAGTIDPFLLQKMEQGTGDTAVIAQFAAKSDLASLSGNDRATRRRNLIAALKAHADASQKTVIAFARTRGAKQIKSLWIANALALQANPALIRALANQPGVVSIRVDTPLAAPIVTYATTSTTNWNLSMVHADVANALGLNGAGTVVATLDTGVDGSHPDIGPRWRGGSNSWFDPNNEHASPYDANGHGTQVMGILVGASTGVAPAATWIAAKIFNDSGVSYESLVHESFQWLLDPDGDPATDDAPDVVNNSWGLVGDNTCQSIFVDDLAVLRTADIAFAFSAGNSGPNAATSVSPANNLGVPSVGAVTETGAVATFSSRGPSACDSTIFPKLVAPGAAVTTTDLSFLGTAQYASVNGTSFASPHVTGGLALLRGAVPYASVADLESALINSAHDLSGDGADNSEGYGLLDIAAAYDRLLATYADFDRDGFATPTDCNDADASVFPGAPEIVRDAVDQDCNGFDLTIVVDKAIHRLRRNTLSVSAASLLNANANLEVAGFGPLVWRPSSQTWTGLFKNVPADLASIEVRGVEGAVTAQVINR